MPPLPKAVRIRTASGWQDIAIVGPPGPQGAQGPQGDVGPQGVAGQNDRIVRTS